MSDDPQARREFTSGYQAHRRAQMLRLARLPFKEKLRWLEEAHQLVLQLQKSDSLTPPVEDDPETPREDDSRPTGDTPETKQT